MLENPSEIEGVRGRKTIFSPILAPTMAQQLYLSQQCERIPLCLRLLTSTGRLATEFSKLSICFIKDIILLFKGHIGRIFMRIAMKTSLTAR